LRRKSKSASGDEDAEAQQASWIVEPEADAAADAEPLTAAEAPAPEAIEAEAPAPEALAPDPPAAAADADTVDENAAAAFAAAGAPPPPPLSDDAWADRLSGAPALTERPEALVGAAFAGGVVFALILKRLAR
jgi:hypothetical protein